VKKSGLLGTYAASLLALISASSLAVVMPLESRLSRLAYYDPNLNITWSANANINGDETWNNQVAWVTRTYLKIRSV